MRERRKTTLKTRPETGAVKVRNTKEGKNEQGARGQVRGLGKKGKSEDQRAVGRFFLFLKIKMISSLRAFTTHYVRTVRPFARTYCGGKSLRER